MLHGRIVHLLSPALVDEYRTALLRPKLRELHGLEDADVGEILVDVIANSVWREPAEAGPAPDPGDDHLWALLSAYPGSRLITGDRLLLESPPKGSAASFPATWYRTFSAPQSPS